MIDEPTWAATPGTAPLLYSNGANVAMSQWDMVIDFQQSAPPSGTLLQGQAWASRGVARIVISPTHAKVLADILNKAVRQWEAAYGELPPPEKLLPQHDATGDSHD
jgi:hypothetical protein